MRILVSACLLGCACRYDGKSIAGFSELSVGDYVVHEFHGLGIYKGIEKIERDGVIKDYIKIEYAKGDSLYVASNVPHGTLSLEEGSIVVDIFCPIREDFLKK